MENEFLKVPEVAKILGIEKRTVYELIKRKDHPLPAVKPSRKLILIIKDELYHWLEETSNIKRS